MARGCAATRLAAIAALLALGLVSQPVAAAEDSSWGYAIAYELMSPYCPGRTLAACPSDEAAELRQWILLQEAAGTSREGVIDILLQRFGDVILSSPEAEGWGLAAWMLPVVALLVGAGLVVVALRRMTGGTDPAVPSPLAGVGQRSVAIGELDDSDLGRIVDEELRASDA